MCDKAKPYSLKCSVAFVKLAKSTNMWLLWVYWKNVIVEQKNILSGISIEDVRERWTMYASLCATVTFKDIVFTFLDVNIGYPIVSINAPKAIKHHSTKLVYLQEILIRNMQQRKGNMLAGKLGTIFHALVLASNRVENYLPAPIIHDSYKTLPLLILCTSLILVLVCIKFIPTNHVSSSLFMPKP